MTFSSSDSEISSGFLNKQLSASEVRQNVNNNFFLGFLTFLGNAYILKLTPLYILHRKKLSNRKQTLEKELENKRDCHQDLYSCSITWVSREITQTWNVRRIWQFVSSCHFLLTYIKPYYSITYIYIYRYKYPYFFCVGKSFFIFIY